LLPVPDLRAQQQIAAERRVNRAFRRKDGGPVNAQYLEKLQCDLPVRGIFRRNEMFKVLQIQPLGMDLIEKARERGREACRLGNAHTAFRPRLNETAEKELSAQGIDSGRQRQQRFAKVPRADIALKQQLVFLDITDGAQ